MKKTDKAKNLVKQQNFKNVYQIWQNRLEKTDSIMLLFFVLVFSAAILEHY